MGRQYRASGLVHRPTPALHGRPTYGKFMPVLTFSLITAGLIPRSLLRYETYYIAIPRCLRRGFLLAGPRNFLRRLARTCHPEVYKIKHAVYEVILLLRWPVSSFLNISDSGAHLLWMCLHPLPRQLLRLRNLFLIHFLGNLISALDVRLMP